MSARIPLMLRILVPVSLVIGTLVIGGAYTFASSETERMSADLASKVEMQRQATVGLLAVIDSLMRARVEGAMTVMRDRAAGGGAPRIAGVTQVGDRVVPNLQLGGTALANEFALVDKVRDLVGGTATVFVRDGEDFVRITTNVVKDGKRATGTVLDPKGAAIAAIRVGKPFYGLVDILGKPYFTAYEPMRDANGQVIGIWYVGYALDMAVLEQHVATSRFLDSGFMAVIDRKGEVRFRSTHVDAATVTKLAADATAGWTRAETTFPAWGFRVLTAYPDTEVSAMSRHRAQLVMGAGFGGWLVIVLLLGVIVRQLVIKPLGGEPAYANEVARRIAAGDLAEPVNVRKGDTRSVLAAMQAAQESVQAMVADTQDLVNSALEGRLDARADVSKHMGDYRRVVEGVNATLDAVMGPLRAAASCVDRMAKGDIPSHITADYRGEFDALKSNLNACISAVNLLVTDADRLAVAAAKGDLATRADIANHQGDYRRVVEGVNSTLDAIVGPIAEVQRIMSSLAAGDLRGRLEGTYQGAFAQLQGAVNESLQQLSTLVGTIRTSAETIDEASEELAAGNANLSQRTEEQAASLEEAASSMEEITAGVQQNADQTRQAMISARNAATVASRGGERVQHVISTMSTIRDNSRQMADIVAVIDGIAFQTNILALNAAVEAARAGEQGRGFAVVSAEVRTLAQRSGSAAREIRELIAGSTATVEAGSRLVEQAGATMQEIVSAVSQVSAIIEQISQACDEQTRGIAQVSAAVTQMDSATQENAALVEQATAAADSLRVEADELTRGVRAFRVDSSAPAKEVDDSSAATPLRHMA